MSRKIFFIILFVIHFSCSKDNGVDLDINGKWELVSVSSMLGGMSYPPGNGNILWLKSNGDVEYQEPNMPTKVGHYTLSKKADCVSDPGREELTIVTFVYPGLRYQNYVSISENKLELNSAVCVSDGGYLVYRRI